MKNNEKQVLTKLLTEHLTYFYKADNDFEVNARIPLEKITPDQVDFLQKKGLSVMTISQNNKEYVTVFNLRMFLEDNQDKDISEKISSDYKSKNFAAKNKNFIMIGSQLGSLSCVLGGALMFATSPVISIALGATAFGLAYYDTRHHTKKIFEKQLETCLSHKLDSSNSLDNIGKIRSQHFPNKSEEIACTL